MSAPTPVAVLREFNAARAEGLAPEVAALRAVPDADAPLPVPVPPEPVRWAAFALWRMPLPLRDGLICAADNEGEILRKVDEWTRANPGIEVVLLRAVRVYSAATVVAVREVAA